jgi:hypothetical protein
VAAKRIAIDPASEGAKSGSVETDSVHHGADVIHPLLERRECSLRDTIRQPGAPLIEEDEPREGSKSSKEAGERWIFPEVLDVRDEARDEDEVHRTVAQ